VAMRSRTERLTMTAEDGLAVSRPRQQNVLVSSWLAYSTPLPSVPVPEAVHDQAYEGDKTGVNGQAYQPKNGGVAP
jgi:hypothetical protein